MLLGFAITQHCNLRCPHCIRDDVTTVRSLEADLLLRVTDEARQLFGEVTVSLTGGEPLLHPELETIVEGLRARAVPWRFVTNGWHLARALPLLDRHPPQAVRLSLSGATEAVHDAERGRGSFRRVMLAAALLTSRRIPMVFSIVIDRRDRHQLAAASELAEGLGAVRLQVILPQPVPQSVSRGSDLEPDEWPAVVREARALASIPGRRTAITVDYGAPPLDGEALERCETYRHQRLYVNVSGELSLCCQLSDYGATNSDVVVDLHHTQLADAYREYSARLMALEADSASLGADDPLAGLPCLRCARASGKLDWLSRGRDSTWRRAALPLVHA